MLVKRRIKVLVKMFDFVCDCVLNIIDGLCDLFSALIETLSDILFG